MGTFYVGGAGEFSTISDAIAAAEQSIDSTNSIIINSGTYTEDDVVTELNGLTISAAPSATVILAGSITLSKSSNITISGLNFQIGTSDFAINATNGSNSLTVTGNMFTGASSNAQAGTPPSKGAVNIDHSDSAVVTGNIFHNTNDAVLLNKSSQSVISSNVMTNSINSAIEAVGGSSYATIENNTIDGTGALGTAGAIWLHGTDHANISHNQITDAAGAGISLSDFNGISGLANHKDGFDTQNNNALISDNYLNNVVTQSTDSGAIYILGRSQNYTGIIVSGNYIGTTGDPTNTTNPHAVGIYLDDNASGVSVSQNIVRATASMTDPWEIHGGSNNSISGNIFDLGSDKTDFGLFQSDEIDQSPLGPFQQLQNDSVTGNIYVTDSEEPHDPGFADLIATGASAPAVTPTISISGNDFWAFSGAPLNVGKAQSDTTGATGDSAAVYTPPATSPAQSLSDYASWGYTDPNTHNKFMPIDTTAIGRQSTEAPCYCPGTLIQTSRGEIAVESLVVGDLLITHSGAIRPLRWIGRRSYTGWLATNNPKIHPICFKANALADGIPRRDLWVSPEHAMFLDEMLVPAGLLVNEHSIVRAKSPSIVQYYHLELDTHDVILAEGAPAESYVDDNSRNMFQNADEFHILYPDQPRKTASFCAPRLESGALLEAIRRRLVGRIAWLDKTITTCLRGQLDLVTHHFIEGWAQDHNAPTEKVALLVYANGAEIGRVVAGQYRADLARSGIGDGSHAFRFQLANGLAADFRHVIEVRWEKDGSLLSGAPAVLELGVTSVLLGASVSEPGATVALGILHGHVDEISHHYIRGWAQNDNGAAHPVGLLVSANGRQLGRVLANRFRNDLLEAGIGNGRHAFQLSFPSTLSVLESYEVRIVREADGVELPGSPMQLQARLNMDKAVEQQLSGLLAAVGGSGDEEHALTLLTQEADRLLVRRAARESSRSAREALHAHRRRWAIDISETLPHGESGVTKRALVIDERVPCITRDAGSVAILSHIRALQTLGYVVTFVAADAMRDTLELQELGQVEDIITCGSPFYSCVEDLLSRQAGTFDIVYLHRGPIADRYLPVARRYFPKARLVYSVADLHHVRLARQAMVESRPNLLALSRHMAAVETMTAQRADVVLTHSCVEAEILRGVTGYGRVHVVPFAIEPRRRRPAFDKRNGLAVLGSFDHAPNMDSVQYLVQEILPLVWKVEPTMICKIVGHGWEAAHLPNLDPRVEVVGSVADLDEVFDTVRLTCAPLRFGAGVKGKVLDSLAAGLPCVMTMTAAEGLGLSGLLANTISNEAGVLAESILRLHREQDLNDQTSVDGVAWIKRNYSASQVLVALSEALNPTSRHQESLTAAAH